MIRRATEFDAHEILECLHEAFAPYREHYTHEGFLDTVLDHESVIRRLREMVIFVAVADDGHVIGTVGCAAGHIRGMAVRPGWQGRGIADRLLQLAEDHESAAGSNRITLDTTEPLQRAIRFYEQHGYQHTGHVGDFFGMPLYELAKDTHVPFHDEGRRLSHSPDPDSADPDRH